MGALFAEFHWYLTDETIKYIFEATRKRNANFDTSFHFAHMFIAHLEMTLSM
jgi:hypothetical protein